MSRWDRALRISVGLVTAVAMEAAAAGPATGVRYYPGKDLVTITALETRSATTTIEDTGKDFKRSRSVTTKREATVALRTVADVANEQTIDLQSKGLSDTTFAVDLSEDGLLRGVNLSSTGRFGDVLTQVAKIAGTVAIVAALGTAKPPGITCNGHAPEFAGLPVNARYFLERSPLGCALARQVLADQAQIQKRAKELRTLEDQIIGAPTKDVAALQRRIQSTLASRDDELKALAAHSDSFAKALTQFEQEQQIGTVALGTSTLTEILELTDLPEDGKVKHDSTEKDVQSALANLTAALDVFKRAKVVVTLGAVPDEEKAATGATATADSKSVEVCFRQSLPLRLRVFLLKSTVEPDESATTNPPAQPSTTAKVQQVAHSVENILHPSVGLSCPTFKASAFGDRKLALSFDVKGRPQKIERQTKSDVAAFTTGVATALATFRDEFAGSLKKLEEIQGSRRTLGMNDLVTRAERLKQEKAVLDAELQLQGATTNFDSVLRRQRSQADLDALNTDLQLAIADESQKQQQEIAQLKVALEQLQKTLEVLKAQRALDEARKQQ